MSRKDEYMRRQITEQMRILLDSGGMNGQTSGGLMVEWIDKLMS